MNFSKLVDKLIEKLELSEEDAIAAAAFSATGFTIDALLFPAGMPPFTVTLLSGIGGYTLSKMYKNNPWYRRKVLNNLDKLVKSGHLSQEKCDYYKNKLIARWLKSGHDIDGNAP